jgi:hypothetical protein
VEVHLKLLGSCAGLCEGDDGCPGCPGGPEGLGGLDGLGGSGGAAKAVAASVRKMLDHFMVSFEDA